MRTACTRRVYAVGLAMLFTCAGLESSRAQAPLASESALHRSVLEQLSAAAIERTRHRVRYDPAYVRIHYPGGDVPADTGVCTDEVIRSYRALGIDLQKEVHEDIAQNPSSYRLHSRPDTNIDHRRVPNLMIFFHRKGESLPIAQRAGDYAPGDIIAWDLGGGVLHIGIVVDQIAPQSNHYMIVHNIGAGPQTEDVIFDWKIVGHYRYFGPNSQDSRN